MKRRVREIRNGRGKRRHLTIIFKTGVWRGGGDSDAGGNDFIYRVKGLRVERIRNKIGGKKQRSQEE